MTDDILTEFFDEFKYRLDMLINSEPDNRVRRDILFLLVENLMLKYENKLQRNKQGLLARLIPFMNNSYDKEFERQINAELEELANSGNGKFNQKLSNTFSQIKNANTLPAKVQDNNLILSSLQPNKADIQVKGHSKTNLPHNIEVALEILPLPGKNQDHADYFVMKNGITGIVLCDGVSGDGPASQQLAQTLPKSIIKYLQHRFTSDLQLNEWKELITNAISYGLHTYDSDKGASTVIVQLVDPQTSQIFIAYMGDGNLIHFNNSMTGFSKLLNPHQNRRGSLTKAVTADGMLGEPDVQILSGSGGALIVSSDGFNLSNGKILKHFYQVVLKSDNLREGLNEWVYGECGNFKYHPEPSDDRSIGIIRWSDE